jgi:hypothetical protein
VTLAIFGARQSGKLVLREYPSIETLTKFSIVMR